MKHDNTCGYWISHPCDCGADNTLRVQYDCGCYTFICDKHHGPAPILPEKKSYNIDWDEHLEGNLETIVEYLMGLGFTVLEPGEQLPSTQAVLKDEK